MQVPGVHVEQDQAGMLQHQGKGLGDLGGDRGQVRRQIRGLTVNVAHSALHSAPSLR
jgi:hypothetical protein